MTEKKSKVDRLSETRLFEHIPEEKLNKIAQEVKKKVVPAQTLIFRQGEPGATFYIITSGQVRVFRKSEEGIETELSLLGPGDSFGEMALLTDNVRSANAVALEETHLLVLTKHQFDEVLKNDLNISVAVVKQMSEWLIRDEMRLEKEAERQARTPKISYLDYVVIFGVSLLCGIIFNMVNPNGISLIPKTWSDDSISSVVHSMAMAKHERGDAIFIDARPSVFYDKKHIKGAFSLPLALFDLMYMMEFSEMDKTKDIIVYGRTVSSVCDKHVARKLILRGHKNTMVLEGGFPPWKEKGYPVEP